MAQSPLEAARKLVPLIRSCANEIEAARELPRPLFEALADAGLFQLALPRVLGGSELDLPSYVEVIEELGKADASTGWCVNQGAIYATYSARMPGDVARAIWIDTPRAVVANTPAATATAVVVPGGYRVTGRQGFSTGCRHASWIAAHAQIVENGTTRLDHGQPETRYFFVPVAEAEILDTWKVRGMRGTGTHHFAVHDVFVPAARTVLSATAPLLHDGPLYRIPRTLVFASGDAAVALGMARTCLSTFYELAGAKTPRAMQALLRDQSMIQVAVGHAEAHLRTGRAFLLENKWRAARYGIEGKLIDFGKEIEVPFRELMEEMLEFVDDVVDELGSRKEVESIRWILENGSGADRQLAVFHESGEDLRKVVDFICDETAHGLESVAPGNAAAIGGT